MNPLPAYGGSQNPESEIVGVPNPPTPAPPTLAFLVGREIWFGCNINLLHLVFTLPLSLTHRNEVHAGDSINIRSVFSGLIS